MSTLADLVRGGLLGATTDLVGTPVDLLTMLMRPLGYKTEKPVMGSEWLSDKLGVQQTGSVPEQAARFATGLLSPGPGELAQMGGLLGAIRAYHGSPHKFDKFDLSKMGTGEGAQAYGWGGYVAEAPSVANYYTVAEGNVFPTIRKGDSRLDLALRESTDVADNKIYAAISQNVRRSTVLDDKTLAQVKKQIQHDADYFAGSPAGTAADAALQKYDDVAAQLKGAQFDYDPGHLYELDLRWPDPAREAADPMGPQHFLDWDKPLSEQPEILSKLRKHNFAAADDASITGEQLHESLLQMGGSDNEIAKELLSAGIVGNKYLDALSRNAGPFLKNVGSRNYVVFDDAIIDLLKRNGVPIK